MPRSTTCWPSRCRSSAARCSRSQTRVVLQVDRSDEAVAFASSVRAPEVSQIGAPCPDHLISTKHKPLFVEFDPDRAGGSELGEAFRAGVAEFSEWYRQYYERNVVGREPTVSLRIQPDHGSCSFPASGWSRRARTR